MNWVLLQGSFIADSNYTFMTIGRFFDDLNTDTIYNPPAYSAAYYYIDNVSVTEDTITEIKTVNNNQNFFIHPNPTLELLMLKGYNSKINEISVIDIANKSLAVNCEIKSENELSVKVSSLKPGIYFLKINNQNKPTCYFKLLKL